MRENQKTPERAIDQAVISSELLGCPYCGGVEENLVFIFIV